MDLYHLVLLMQEQHDEVSIHLHPLASGELMTDAWHISLFIYTPLTLDADANARDNNAVLALNKRAMTVLYPRLPAEISRATACNHVLVAAIARPNAFVPRLYLVCTTCAARSRSR